jgi:hypothetical protein
LSPTFIKTIKRNDLVKWYCEKCDGALNSFNQKINELSQLVKENFLNLENKTVEICDMNKSSSYADMLKKNVGNVREKEPVVLIKPNKDQKFEEMRNFVTSMIDPLSVPVSGLMKASRGGLLVKTLKQLKLWKKN